MKIGFDFWVVWVFLGIFLAVQSLDDVQAEGEVDSHHRTATAIRINSAPPQLDGVLDDEIWKSAPLHEGFHQRDPDEGKPATERTTFQIAYDGEAIYFAVMCYDNEPQKIVSRLVRRDSYVESDKVTLSLDPHYNRQNSFWFTVYSSGSVTDGIAPDTGRGDNTWDGVWDVKTKIHENGWAAEYKILFHILRFSPKDEYTWGYRSNDTSAAEKSRITGVSSSTANPAGRLALVTSAVSKISTRPVIWSLCLTPWGAHTSMMKPSCGAILGPMSNMGLAPGFHLMPRLTPILDKWRLTLRA